MTDPTSTVSATPEIKDELKSFSALAADLGIAEADTKSKSGDATAARNKKQIVATDAIRAAFTEGVDTGTVRALLLASGVLKGTASKIVTILDALAEGVLLLSDVKSLNGGYNLVKKVRLAEREAEYLATHPAAKAAKVAAIVATTPGEALEILLSVIRDEPDVDRAYALGGKLITKVTNAVTKITKSKSDDDEE